MQTAHLHHWIERARAGAAHPRLPDLVAVVLVILLGWQFAAVTWAALPMPASAEVPALQRANAAPSPSTDRQDTPTAQLARLHLFGEIDRAAKSGNAQQTVSNDAPDTQLDLTLKGLYTSGDGKGIAIIATGSGPEKVYAVDDKIAGSASISRILDDRVILQRNGRAEALPLHADNSGGGTARSSGDTDRKGRGGDVVQRARSLRQQLRKNPLALARMARLQPYRQDGNLVGYRIQRRSDEAQLLSDIGIQPDDVVTRVNGIPLNDREQAGRALRELRDARMINVTVLRNGNSRRLSIPIGNPG